MAKCTACRRRQAFYMRQYSGEKLCRRCFAESIEEKVRVTIGKYKMFEVDDRIAVAVSGGKDSVSLLHILAKIEEDFPKSSVCAVTVDEGISGYRAEAVMIAAESCSKLGVEQLTLSFKELYGHTMDGIVEETRHGKLTPCAYCGVLRRRALNVAGRKAGADKIATAHTLDDEIQTFLLNVIHGDPLRITRSRPRYDREETGLVRRVKPFCEVLERESALYAYVKELPFQEVPCPYAREALRNDVRHTLNRLERKHPGMKYTIYSSMVKIREAMKGTVEEIPLKSCEDCGEPTTGTLCQACTMIRELRDT